VIFEYVNPTVLDLQDDLNRFSMGKF